MNKLLIVTEKTSDFTSIMANVGSCTVINPCNLTEKHFTDYDSFAILESLTADTLYSALRKTGKPAFVRTRPGLGAENKANLISTRFRRLVACGSTCGIRNNTLLDDQDNLHLPALPGPDAEAFLIYGDNIMSHSVFNGSSDKLNKEDYALWKEGNVMYCSFDISNFAKARFAPLDAWRKIISYTNGFLLGEKHETAMDGGYTNGFLSNEQVLIPESFDRALSWFDDAGILVNEGLGGVFEGFATEIKSDGSQKKAVEIRNDCCGEVMFTYYLDSLLTGGAESSEVSDNLSDYIFSEMFTDEPGSLLDGMMKWSLNSPGICYQDDVARAIIPQMLKCRFSGSARHLEKCTRALDFLFKTTGTDGLRVTRTENQRLDKSEVERLASEPAEYPSAHYTAYYLGALLLNSVMTGNEKFMDMGVRGLETIMAAYPDTKRCQSETQEYARLILPLAMMYEATGKPEHLEMLYRVTADLKRFRHESGTYIEWDTGYKSRYSRTTGDECSILTENGDPVSDLLYTVNWLPLGFIYAYFVTKDEMFYSLWEDISSFMAKAQIISGNPDINGAWARGWDTELNEVFALPNDVGWGPWCIESGWTVAEIASGLAMGLLKDDLLKFF